MSGFFRNVPSLGRWSSKWTSRFHSSWFSSSKGGAATSRWGPAYSGGKRKRTDYREMDKDVSSSGDNKAYSMAPVKPIRTFVHTGGGSEEVEENGIHLQYKFEQVSVADEHRRV